MFYYKILNMNDYTKKQGRIEVICGCMFSGKSEELISRARRAAYSKKKIQIFNPSIDTRYGENSVSSHNKNRLQSASVKHAREILKLVKPSTHVVAVDEANFFGAELAEVCAKLAESGKRVIVAGLDLDYKAKPFESIAALLPHAEYVTKTMAACNKCGSPACRTKRMVKTKGRIVLGKEGDYEARCRKCFPLD